MLIDIAVKGSYYIGEYPVGKLGSALCIVFIQVTTI